MKLLITILCVIAAISVLVLFACSRMSGMADRHMEELMKAQNEESEEISD